MQRDMAICVLIMRLQVIISVLSRRECDKLIITGQFISTL